MVDIKARYKLELKGVNAHLYIWKGIPELEDGAPFWLYNGLRDLLHEGRKCHTESEVGVLIAKIKERGFKVSKATASKKPSHKVKWVGSENVEVKAKLDEDYDERRVT